MSFFYKIKTMLTHENVALAKALVLLFFLAGNTVHLLAAPGDLIIEPEGGSLANGQEISLSFPAPMVDAERIGTEEPKPPVQFAPEPLAFKLYWVSQTEARLRVLGPVIPGATYAIRTTPGARFLDGAPLTVTLPVHKFTVPEFDVVCSSESSDRLSENPFILLTFTHAVDVRQLADKIFFIDSSSQRRHPVEVLLGAESRTVRYDPWEDSSVSTPVLPPGVADSDAPFLQKRVSVQPRHPLVAGRDWKLLIEGATEATSGKGLRFPRVFAIGSTPILQVEWVGAFNHAGSEPFIKARFSQNIEPESISTTTVKVEPSVPGLHVVPLPPRDVEIRGEFDTTKRYKVILTRNIKSSLGFALSSDSTWGATFKQKQSSIIFPDQEIQQRSSLGLNFSFIQSNTGTGRWRLAAIPHEKLAAVRSKLREFTQLAADPATGQHIPHPDGFGLLEKPTELLIDYFNLKEKASGDFEPAPDVDVQREIRWRPSPDLVPYGPYLLEVTAPGPEGKLRANRSIIWFSEFAVAQKRTSSELIVRVSTMSDGAPVADAMVSAVADDGTVLVSSKSAPDGIAKFKLAEVFPPRSRVISTSRLVVKQGERMTSVPVSPRNFNSGSTYGGSESFGLAGFATTDRPIYRPGEVLHAKGFIRDLSAASTEFTNNSAVHVRVFSPSGTIATEFDAPLTPFGGWELEWEVPLSAALGYYRLEASLGDRAVNLNSLFQVEEIRKPLFSVEVEKAPTEPGEDAITIKSAYFHGSPNANAVVRWTSEWFSYSDWDWEIKHNDQYTESATQPAYAAKTSGEARLDANGFLKLSIPPPFQDKAARARCYVNWTVDVISPEGQTITAGTAHTRQIVPAAAGIATSESLGEERGIKVRLVAVDEEDNKLTGLPMTVEVFRLEVKSFKQQLAPMVFRYVNSENHIKIASKQAMSGDIFVVPTRTPARYVVSAKLQDNPSAPLVSDRTTITGFNYAQFPVETEDALALELERSNLRPGEVAVIKTNGPRGGIAWVTVENREVLESKILRIDGNAGRIELPIKPEYSPNAVIAVHLISPGGEEDLPVERFGSVAINVERPDLNLDLLPKLNAMEYEPGVEISGQVEVKCEGRPVPNAEVAVWAVDESILKLGSWQLPQVLASFLPNQPWSVVTYSALGELVRGIKKEMIFQKGFILGDGGESGHGSVLIIRENFKPLAFWAGRLSSDSQGNAFFSFKAPDNLTTWRVIALGQTGAGQYGAGSCTFVVNKKLIIEPALPRFVRSGDLVELRAVVRQQISPSATVRVAAQTKGGALEIISPQPKIIETAQDAGVVVKFPARAYDAVGVAKVRFFAESSTLSDAFEVELPVVSPEVFARETETFTVPPGTKTDISAALPQKWLTTNGTFTATVSSSTFYPKLAGLPALFDYPHGCLEQISSRLLGYSLLGDLLDYLPDGSARRNQIEAVIPEALKTIQRSLLEDGSLPYWPGSRERNLFVTAQTAWMVAELQLKNISVSEQLSAPLFHALGEIVAGRIYSDAETQALALFVSAIADLQPDEAANAADSMYLRREHFSHETRSLLALALTTLQHNMPARDQLLKEIDGDIPPPTFNSQNFSSLTRTEALRIVAKSSAGGKNWSKQAVADAKNRLLGLMESGADLSTQENLWTLFAFRKLLGEGKLNSLSAEQFKPAPKTFSTNKASATWEPMTPDALASITARATRHPLTWVLSGQFTLPPDAQEQVDRGIRIERVIKNLTSPERTGSLEHPFKIGDQVVITYRLVTDRLQFYIAVEDPLPAILETINPDIASVAQFYQLPENSEPLLPLSHSELRDQVNRLYFDRVEKGSGVFAVLARVTSVGRACWPGPTATPMYDARWSGRGLRTTVYSVEE